MMVKAVNRANNPPAPERLTYRIAEVMQALGVSKTKVMTMMRSGELPTVKVGGCTLIRREDLMALLTRKRAA